MLAAGEHLPAIEVGRRALAIAAERGDRELALEAQYRTGQAYFAIGDYRQARDFLSQCTEGAGEGRRHPAKLFASWSHTWLALTLSSLGRFVDARSHAQEALSIAEGADHPFTLAEALTGAGSVSLDRGDFDHAIDALERARVLIRAWNLQPWAVLARLGYAYALAGRSFEARGLLEEGARSATTMSSMGVGRAMQLAWLGEAYLLEGRCDDALERARQALALAQRHQERSHEAWSLRLLGEIGSRRNPLDVEAAAGYYGEALALASELGMRPLVAHCHFHLGELFRKTDGREQARGHLTTATMMFREMDMRFWLEKAEAEVRPPSE